MVVPVLNRSRLDLLCDIDDEASCMPRKRFDDRRIRLRPDSSAACRSSVAQILSVYPKVGPLGARSAESADMARKLKGGGVRQWSTRCLELVSRQKGPTKACPNAVGAGRATLCLRSSRCSPSSTMH